MTWIDLTHPFTSRMPVYPGDPAPRLRRIASLEQDSYENHEIQTGMHTGTHLDGPRHMVANQPFLSSLPIARFCGRGVLVDARGLEEIGPNVIPPGALIPGDIVLFLTGHSALFGQGRYFEKHPVLTEALSNKLILERISIAGLDAPSPDRHPYLVHKLLLGAGVLILENLANLEKLLGVRDFEVLALPLSVEADSAPARVVARTVPGPIPSRPASLM